MRLLQHTAYATPRALLRMAMDAHRPGHMIFIIGPSGVGKTTMRRSVMQELFGHPALWGTGRTPVVETFALLSKNAYFSSMELAKALVDELHAPRLDWLLSGAKLTKEEGAQIESQLEACALAWTELRPKRATEGEYWAILQRGLRARGCKYVSLDQITALLVNHKNKEPADHTLHLMTLAEAAGVMFIMTGVHHAAELWAVHPELRRRVFTVWVPPYSHKRASDREPFLRLLKSFEEKYPIARDGTLVGMSADVLAATGGVFAEIVQLLDRAHARAQIGGQPKILKQHIEASYLSDKDIEELWHQIEEFERAMAAGDIRSRAKLISAQWSVGGGEQAHDV